MNAMLDQKVLFREEKHEKDRKMILDGREMKLFETVHTIEISSAPIRHIVDKYFGMRKRCED